MTSSVLSARELEQALAGHRGWRLRGEALVQELEFKDFDEALSFVERVGHAAVDYQRRPDMCITEFNRVTLTIENRHHAGFTLAEMRLLEKVNAILDEHHPEAART
jgi:pterin-4a-carbinolamine dehydratase